MASILAGLNSAQREAVTSDAKVLQVLAPPGSGKTKTLTARVGNLIATGLPPWSIIVCTFTVKAAREMQKRIQEMVQESHKIKIGTFHGIALRYLRQHRKLMGLGDNFGVADTADSTAILKRIVKRLDAQIEPAQARSRISGLKAKGIECEKYAATEGKRAEKSVFAKIYTEYQDELQRAGLLDYDDLLLRCVELLKSHPSCVEDIKAVLVDEFQDTNNVQYELMALFAQKCQNITIVGDPDQSIYGWRSAEIKNLGRMRQRWSDTLTINLEQNYRSAASILHAAQAIIEQDQHRPPKSLLATLSYGHKPVLRRLPGAREEAQWLVEEIKRLQALTGALLQHSDFAVLLRTASLSRVIEAALGTAGIPYRMVGGVKFFERVEIKIVLDYLRVIDSPSHGEALVRVLNVPPRRIGDKTIEALQKAAQDKRVTIWSLVQGIAWGQIAAPAGVSQLALSGLEQFTGIIRSCRGILSKKASIFELVKAVLAKAKLEDFLRTKYPEDFDTRWSGIQDLIAQASEAISTEQEEASASSSLTDFLANAALAASIDEKNKEQESASSSMVTISTMHAAKGLEWPVVFVPACFNGSMPHSRSEDHDEERRLLYVAMTRAQAMLYLSCPSKDTQRQETALSTFVDQPNCTKLFDERGPRIGAADVASLSQVLRRPTPSADEVRQSSADLLRDLDDLWPTDGSAPLQEDSQVQWTKVDGKWTKAAEVPQAGFASVRSQFDTLQREVASRKEPAINDVQAAPVKPDIASFFAPRTAMIAMTTMQKLSQAAPRATKALMDITTAKRNGASDDVPSRSTHDVRSEPLKKKQCVAGPALESASIYNPYTMFSSSPLTPEEPTEVKAADNSAPLPSEQYKSASTTHRTSFRSAIRGRKTLGAKPGFNGWANRGNKSASFRPPR